MKNLQLLLLFVLITFCVNAQKTVNEEKVSQLNKYIQHLENENQIIGTISVFENNEEVYNNHFGQENLESQDGTSEELKYQIGSITKMFTAVLLAKLAEDGKLKLDSRLSQYYKDMPNANKISLRQMMNHTSGLGNYVSKNDTDHYWLKEPVKQEEIFTEIKRKGVLFQPGDSMAYSNSAYYLLTRILEREYGQRFAEIVKTQITKPLGLNDTYGIGEGDNYKNIAHSYEKKGDTWSQVEEFYFPNASGAGDIISTGYDLNVFINALNSGEIISKKTLETMKAKEGEWFGEGIMMVPFYDHIGFGHGGDTYGTHSVLSYFPDEDLSIIYSINGENYPTNEFAIDVLSILFDQDFEMPDFNRYNADINFYKNYTGTYGADNFPMKIKIFQEKEVLKAEGEGQPSFDLTPKEENVFEFLPASIVIEFKPSEEKLILNQGGQAFELSKMK